MGGDDRELLDGTLAGGVKRDARCGQDRVDGGHVDDPSAVGHAPGRLPQGFEDGPHVDLHHPLVVFVGQLGEGPYDTDAGVVDKDVQGRGERLSGVPQPGGGAGLGQVGLDGPRPAAGRGHAREDLLGGALVGAVAEGDGSPVASQSFHHGPPNPT